MVTLKMGSNELTGAGMATFFDAMAKNCSLSEIVITTEGGIARNRMTTRKSQFAMKRFLLYNKFCTILRMRGVFLGVDGLDIILDSMCSAQIKYQAELRLQLE